MGGREDLIASLRAIMAEREGSRESPPSPEELVAYREGLLAPEERAAVAAKLDRFPDAARALADLDAFPDVEPAPGVEEPGEADVRAGWADFQRRLEERQVTPATTTPERRHDKLSLAAAAVVLLVVGLFLGFLLGRAVPGASVNDTVVELRPVEEGRVRDAGEGRRRVELAPGAGHLVLLLAVTDPGDFADYSVWVESGAGREIFRARGLRPDRLGTFRVTLPVRRLDAGRLRVVLSGHAEGEERVVATYAVTLDQG